MIAIIDKIKWAFLAIGVILIIGGIYGEIKLHEIPDSLEQVSEITIDSVSMVEGDVPMNFGTYEEEYETHFGIPDKSSLIWYYIIPIEDKYMGIAIHANSLGSSFDIQTAKTFDWMENDKMPAPTGIHVKGNVRKMSDQDRDFFKQALVYGGYSASEAESLIVPYYIYEGAYADALMEIIIGIVASVLGVAGIIVSKKFS